MTCSKFKSYTYDVRNNGLFLYHCSLREQDDPVSLSFECTVVEVAITGECNSMAEAEKWHR